MKMFFTSISNCLILGICVVVFQSNVGCFNAALPFLGIVYSNFAESTGFVSSLTVIIASSMAVCEIVFIMFCLATISLLFLLSDNALCMSASFCMLVCLMRDFFPETP